MRTLFGFCRAVATPFGLGFVIAALLLSETVNAADTLATEPSNGNLPHIARFFGDHKAAITLTFDDNLRDQFEVAAPLLDKYNLKATFFVIAGLTPETEAEAKAKKVGEWGGISWAELRVLAAKGHEISSHSWSHSGLDAKINDVELNHQVNDAYDEIAKHMGKPPLTFCYPFNTRDDRVRAVVHQRHIAAREEQFAYSEARGKTKPDAPIDVAIEKGTWIVAMIHGITQGYDSNPDLAVFENRLAYLKEHQDKIWVDTFANVYRYTAERDAAKLSCEVTAGKALITLRTPLDPKIYDRPLTIVIPAAGAATVTATQAGKPVPATIAGARILVDLVPSGESVTVSWK